jgi:hypothetical protein
MIGTHEHGQLPDWEGSVLEKSQDIKTRMATRHLPFLVNTIQAGLSSHCSLSSKYKTGKDESTEKPAEMIEEHSEKRFKRTDG